MMFPQDAPRREETPEDLLREAERLRQRDPVQEKEGSEAGPASRCFLVFSLGEEWYAVDLAHVRRVLRPSSMAHVPGAAAEVLGLMNCHGEVLCVLDLRKVLGIAGETVSGEGNGEAGSEGRLVVVLHYGEKEAGVLVDGVDDIWDLPVSAVQPPLESLEPSRAKLFEGTVGRDGRFVGLLNVSMCLNP